MEVFEWVRLILGSIFLFVGLAIFALEMLGVYRFRYVLNRMHAAAMGDTLGIGMSLFGVMIFSGFNFTTLKIGLIVMFLWFASPVSSHLISRLEITTNEELDQYCEDNRKAENKDRR